MIDALRNCDLKNSVNRFNIHVHPPKIKCRKVVGAYKAYQAIRYTEASEYRVARSMRNAALIPATWKPVRKRGEAAASPA